MLKALYTITASLTAVLLALPPARAQSTVIVAVPAQAGAVSGTNENSDAFIWRLFVEFATPVSKERPSPVIFETWASDEDTFSTNPHWPAPGTPIKLHRSLLQSIKTANPNGPSTNSLLKIDVACIPPVGAA